MPVENRDDAQKFSFEAVEEAMAEGFGAARYGWEEGEIIMALAVVGAQHFIIAKTVNHALFDKATGSKIQVYLPPEEDRNAKDWVLFNMAHVPRQDAGIN